MSCTFVPPYLLRHLATTAAGTPAGACGRSTLVLDRRLRELRSGPALLRRPHPSGPEATVPRRVVHSAGGTEHLPGTRVRSDDDPPSGDVAVDEPSTPPGRSGTSSPSCSTGTPSMARAARCR